MDALARTRPWDGNLVRASLSLPLYASRGRIAGSEKSHSLTLYELVTSDDYFFETHLLRVHSLLGNRSAID